MDGRPTGELRRGWTTGTCAAAGAASACHAFLAGSFLDPVPVRLPGGAQPRFPLALAERTADGAAARAGIVKDAGDDPDVTHGALIVTEVSRGAPGSGLTFRAGPGVGTVTRPGLPLAVGEPAINPGPRAIIATALAEIASACGTSWPLDLTVTVSVPGGEDLAAKTLNGRLGIVGGLSILGTTGIVVPYSCAAWVHSIHRGIDVARAAGLEHIAGATGSTSEAAIQHLYGLPEIALIDMGDFIGGMLKYLRRHPVPRVTVAGGFAKLAKLADGALDLHSGRSRVDLPGLAARLAALGAPAATVAAARQAGGAGEVLTLAAAADPGLAAALVRHVAERARDVAVAALADSDGSGTAVDIAVFDRAGALLGQAGP